MGSPVVASTCLSGGSDFGPAFRVRFADGTGLFLKAIATDHVLFPRYREEAAVNTQLPARVPVLRLRYAWQACGWWLMAFDDVTGARHPDLTPGRPDTARALELMDRLSTTVMPSPTPGAPGFVEAVGDDFCGWRKLADTGALLDPWSTRYLDRLAATERFWAPYAEGTTLLHGDLGPDTMLLTDGGDIVTDWAYLHQGAAWIDTALFLPHLLHSGHTPERAETVMGTKVAAWADAPPEAVTFFAIALTGYWEYHSRCPAPPHAPVLRPLQARMAALGRAWVRHRTGWS